MVKRIISRRLFASNNARVLATGFRNGLGYSNARLRIVRARWTLSETTDTSRGEGRVMFSSLASRTAAMMAAHIATVDANLCRILESSSLAMALFISPMKIG